MKRKNLLWWQDTVVYEIYPASFKDTNGDGIGDLKGITSEIDYIASLGIGAIWLTPVYKSPMVDNGYDVQDYYEINPRFGTMQDMEELIAEAKKRGIKIVMDLVFNHTSDKHEWFLESKKNRTNKKSDWYIWRDAGADGNEPNNWRSIFGGPAWTWCQERGQYYLHTFASAQPDVNWENADLRHALYDIANFWLSKGVGGFRIDAITYIKKPSDFSSGEPDAQDGLVAIHGKTANMPGILDFLNEFKKNVREGRDIFSVGEANGVSSSELKNWVGSEGVFDMLFEFSHINIQFQNGENWCYPNEWNLIDLKKVLVNSQRETAANGWYPIFFENHDQPRSISHFFSEGVDQILAAKTIATVLMTMRGTPFLFQAQELGYKNVAWKTINEYDDISSHSQYAFACGEGFSHEEAMKCVHAFSRDNSRTPMQWTDGENAGFSSGKTWLPVHEDYATKNVAIESGDANSVLSYYRTLAKLRAENDVLITGSFESVLETDEKIFAYIRASDEGDGISTVVVLINFFAENASYEKSLVNGMHEIINSYGNNGTPGILRPLEAVVFAK